MMYPDTMRTRRDIIELRLSTARDEIRRENDEAERRK